VEIDGVMRDMVGYICVDQETPDGIRTSAIGTGFFVTVFHDDNRSSGTSYLVTAKHVWSGLADFSAAYVRLNSDDPTGGSGLTPLHKGWKFHPDPTVDIAVLPWVPVAGTIGGFTSMAVEDLVPSALELRNLKAKKLKGQWPPEPGVPLYMIGLLVHHAGGYRNIPTVRVGNLSMVTSDPIAGTLGPSSYHLADLQTYPGHSGAPVWVELGDAVYLLGVMVGGFPEPQAIVSKRRGEGWVVHEHHALGISLITPIEKVFDIIWSPELKAQRLLDAERSTSKTARA